MERFDRSKLPDFCFEPEMTDPCLETTILGAAERLLYIIAKGRHPDEEFSSSEASDILCGDFPKRKCQASWSKPTLSVHCETCGLTPTSCVCFNCFLGGNHEGHRVLVHYSHAGYCDCGDETLWDPKGFCDDHTASDEGCEMGDGTEKEIEILKFYCYSLLKMVWDRFEAGLIVSMGVLSALSKFISIGDLPRRCCAIELSHMNIVQLLSRVVLLGEWVSERLLDFLGHMASDRHFRIECAKQIVPNYQDIIRHCMKMVGLLTEKLATVRSLKNLKKNYDFLFHAFQTSVLNSLLDNGLDWYDVVTKSLNQLLAHECEIETGILYTLANMGTHLRRVMQLARVGLARADYETRNKFFEYFIDFCNKLEHPNLVSRELGDKRDDRGSVYQSLTDLQIVLLSLPVECYENLNVEAWKLAATDIKVTAFYQDDIDHDNILEGQPFAVILPSSVIAANLLSSNFAKCEEIFRVQENRDLLPSLVRLPLRLFAAYILATCNFFVRNPDSLVVHFLSVHQNRSKRAAYHPLFVLIQLAFGYCDDVSYLIERMMVCFGLESRNLDRDQQSDVINLFLHYLNCLIFDRMCYDRDFFGIVRIGLINKLKVKPIQASKLSAPGALTDRLLDDLKSFATQTMVNGKSYFTLTDDSEWHCLLPMVKYSDVKVVISEVMKKNPDSLVRFPSFEPEKYGLKLGRVLHDYIVLALIYEYLSDFLTHGNDSVIRPIHVQYLLNMIVQGYNISEDKTFAKGSSEPWIVETRAMLVSKMKDAKMKYNEFMYQPIGLGGKQIRTLYELLIALGPLGLSVLERMSVEIPPDSKDMESLKQARKERVARLRQEIKESFAKQAQAILPFESDVQEESTSVCSVCNEGNSDQVLCFPGIMFRSVLLSTVRYTLSPETDFAPKFGLSLSICLHLLHPGCLQEVAPFACPIDRMTKNFLLPYIPTGFGKPPPAADSAIYEFMRFVFENDFLSAVICLRSEIALLEIRQRAIENAADDIRSKTLIRNLFFTIRHWKDEKEVCEDNGTMITLLQWMLTQPSVSESAVKSRVKKDCEKWFRLKTRTHRAHSFLRRTALLIHCLFHDITKSENWDDFLSLGNLFAYYGIEREVPDNWTLPVFKFCRLPKNFFDFAKEPYAVDMSHPQRVYFSLLTGVILSETAPRVDGDELMDKVKPFATIALGHAPEVNSFTFAPMISLAGRDAGECFCMSYEWELRVPLQPLYVDRFGECHPGFRHQELLTLKSEEALINLVDVILSHRWTDIIS